MELERKRKEVLREIKFKRLKYLIIFILFVLIIYLLIKSGFMNNLSSGTTFLITLIIIVIFALIGLKLEDLYPNNEYIKNTIKGQYTQIFKNIYLKDYLESKGYFYSQDKFVNLYDI